MGFQSVAEMAKKDNKRGGSLNGARVKATQIRIKTSIPKNSRTHSTEISIPECIHRDANFHKGDHVDILVDIPNRTMALVAVRPNSESRFNGWKLSKSENSTVLKFRYSGFAGSPFVRGNSVVKIDDEDIVDIKHGEVTFYMPKQMAFLDENRS